MATRRTFLKYATIGVGVVGAGVGLPALAADSRPLFYRRLGASGFAAPAPQKGLAAGGAIG
jgi:hypothetical protein